jgi:hypothetical protein
MMAMEEKTPFVATVEELAASRGIGSLDELVDLVNEAPAEFPDEESLSVEELAGWPRHGYGNLLDAVLHFHEEERMKLVRSFAATFFPEPRSDR